MKSFLVVFFFIGLLSCADSPGKSPAAPGATSHHSDTNSVRYFNLMNGLKYEYVLYYRTMKNFSSDVTVWAMPDNDSAFKMDSIKYWKSYRDFFNQDRDFINWLIGFKNDTTASGLWSRYHNPISSNLDECNLDPSNSRAAIILVENFIVGDGFTCFECKYPTRQECNIEKYSEIETFLFAHKGKAIPELRAAWQKKNEHYENSRSGSL